MKELSFDIVIIGMGLGAAAIAQRLRATDARIVMVPGVGCARFKHLDGGIIAPGHLEGVFGTSVGAPLHSVGDTCSFRRDLLETWAMERVRDRVTVINDFADLRVVPHASGKLSLHEEAGKREIVANLIVLTEGASPKIGIAAKIRPDFEPEDLLHAGRTILSGIQIAAPITGDWRTSWGMPAWFGAIPYSEGAIVSASARIENIMRVGRDGREVLADFLRSPIAAGLGIADTGAVIGMELVPLRPAGKPRRVGTHRMLIAPDANGTIDPRGLDRYINGLTAGAEIGSYIARQWSKVIDWDDVGNDLAPMFSGERTPYHDASKTGFIDEGKGRPVRTLLNLFKR